MRKRGREGRALAPGPAREPLSPRRRRAGAAARGAAGGRQRKRAPAFAAADRRPDRARPPAGRSLGRPRLRLAGARAEPARARDRAAAEQAPTAPATARSRAAQPRGLARPQTRAQNARRSSPASLAGRTHKRLAESETPERHPP